LKLKYNKLLSNSAFSFNLRRFMKELEESYQQEMYERDLRLAEERQGLTLVHFSAQRKRFLWDRGCIYWLL
jgi:hypothetical protein